MSAPPPGWTIERPATGAVIARGPNGEVAMEESCRRCGARVIGAITERGEGVFIEVDPSAPLTFRGPMPSASNQRRHFHPEAK